MIIFVRNQSKNRNKSPNTSTKNELMKSMKGPKAKNQKKEKYGNFLLDDFLK